MTDKEKIKTEIERLIDDLGEQRDINLEDLRDFINSLPEEQERSIIDNLQECTNNALANETKESWNDFHWESVSEEIEEAIKVASEKERLRKAKNESRFFSPVDFASGSWLVFSGRKTNLNKKPLIGYMRYITNKDI